VNRRNSAAAVRRGWPLVVAGLILGAAGAFGISSAQTPMFVSHTQFFVSTTGSSTTSEVYQGSQFSQQRVTSYAQLLTGPDLVGRVVQDLGLSVSVDDLASRIYAEPVVDTVLINVAVSDASPVRARDIAVTLGEEFTRLAGTLEASDGNGQSPVVLTVSRTAEVPEQASSPAVVRNVLLGGVVGVVMAMLLLVGRSRLDRTVRTSEDVTDFAGTSVIGVIIKDDLIEKRSVLDWRSSSPAIESFRQLRTNLQFLHIDEPPKVIMVSSAVPSEGKTTLAVNLSLALAEAGRSVTLVEGDLRRPRVTKYLSMVGGAGLTNILAGTAELADVLQRHGDGRLKVIAAGPTPPNPSEMLASSHMYKLIDDRRASSAACRRCKRSGGAR
jgi:capsular polysaccharide biosynthesis protein